MSICPLARPSVLKGVDLEIRPGEFFAFLGPSGSGKSTLLRAIAGFGPTPKGRIRLANAMLVGLDPWSRNVGMVFQSYALWPHMSVRDNVAFGLRERRVPTADAKRRVGEVLDLVGLAHLAERMPNQLSGGQQQRIALARTIIVERGSASTSHYQPRCGLTRTDAQSCYVFNVSWV